MTPTGAADELKKELLPLRPNDPKRVGRYRLIGRLGSGGMGVVFLAKDRSNELVAIKLIRPEYADDALFRTRFKREVESARRVSAVCTARVVDADVETARPYLVTEYVRGMPLDKFVRDQGPLRGTLLEAFALALAEALCAIHQAGLVHRDLKPSNVLIGADGPRVIDFGIARATDATVLTHTGVPLGTPAWMAPEQARGEIAGSPADVFAWAALVAFAGTGRPPFGQGAADGVLYRVVHERPDLDGLDRAIVRRISPALAKEPATRPTAEQLLRSFLGEDTVVHGLDESRSEVRRKLDETWITEPDRSDELASVAQTSRWKPRNLVLVGILIVAMAFLGIWKLPSRSAPPRARPPSTTPSTIPTGRPTTPPSAASGHSAAVAVTSLPRFGVAAQQRLDALVRSERKPGLCPRVTLRSQSSVGPYVVCNPRGSLMKVVIGAYYSRQTMQTGLASTPQSGTSIVIYKPAGVVFTYEGDRGLHAARLLAHELGRGAVVLRA
jgi:serine/threonine protein kinase